MAAERLPYLLPPAPLRLAGGGATALESGRADCYAAAATAMPPNCATGGGLLALAPNDLTQVAQLDPGGPPGGVGGLLVHPMKHECGQNPNKSTPGDWLGKP